MENASTHEGRCISEVGKTVKTVQTWLMILIATHLGGVLKTEDLNT